MRILLMECSISGCATLCFKDLNRRIELPEVKLKNDAFSAMEDIVEMTLIKVHLRFCVCYQSSVWLE